MCRSNPTDEHPVRRNHDQWLCTRPGCVAELEKVVDKVKHGAQDQPRPAEGRANVHHNARRAAENRNDRRNDTMTVMLAQRATPFVANASHATPGCALQMLTYDPDEDHPSPNRVPDISNGFFAKDADGHRVPVSSPRWSLFLFLLFSCASGKNYQMLNYLRHRRVISVQVSSV